MKTVVAMSLVLFWASLSLAQGVGFVAAVSGDARLVRDGTSVEISVGAEIREGDQILTGAKGRVKILLSDDSILALGNKSDLRIEAHRFSVVQKERKTRINLGTGAVRALVQKTVHGGSADFEVRTGNAVAGVRGTEFVLESDNGSSRLSTLSGEVEFSTAEGVRALVAAGQGSRLGAEGGALASFSLSVEDVARLRRDTEAEQGPEMLAFAGSVPVDDRLGGPTASVPADGSAERRTDSSTAGNLGSGAVRSDGNLPLGGMTPENLAASAWGNPVDGQGSGDWTWQWDNKNAVTGGRSIQVQIVLRK
ncbi:MAG: FecR domain-containing protein [Myxococcales bacterium]|nr:FecR domain-containing protein [Myxococcales bacterium]